MVTGGPGAKLRTRIDDGLKQTSTVREPESRYLFTVEGYARSALAGQPTVWSITAVNDDEAHGKDADRVGFVGWMPGRGRPQRGEGSLT